MRKTTETNFRIESSSRRGTRIHFGGDVESVEAQQIKILLEEKTMRTHYFFECISAVIVCVYVLSIQSNSDCI